MIISKVHRRMSPLRTTNLGMIQPSLSFSCMEKDKLQNLIQELIAEYAKARSKIPSLPDDELLENADYQRCMGIYHLITMVQKEPEIVQVVAETDDYDTQRLIERVGIQFQKGEDGAITYSVDFRDS